MNLRAHLEELFETQAAELAGSDAFRALETSGTANAWALIESD